ncbi:DUF2087 domain-containing protein [Enterococcus sp. ALS3]|uniref:DUF2087 domain-containing protein n=1 Tax=Enterococcus alishanensis TaxID=1303817 RepID=A0ABS6T955_9ENTE|nr:DUF2087 domain-containing protein [Enterococcus alishanensis]MBV7389433.1 DUF2087 domain-containing protein [Enterococcus alishanensis]
MDITNLSLEAIKQGWHLADNKYHCNYCDAVFAEEEIFQIGEKFFSAEQAVIQHLIKNHAGKTNPLIHLDSKYNTLTDKQKDLLTAFASGKKDAEIAELFKVSPSTIRHQKFTFRQKAKQAKLYLATFENVFQKDDYLPIPLKATDVDDRFAITEEEYTALIKKYFDFSKGVQLKQLPKGQKKIIAILNRVIEEIPTETMLTEKELNQYLTEIYFDYVTLRRYLIDYGFLSRTTDGKKYWRESNK